MKNKIALMLSALLLAGMLAGCGTKTADPAPDTPAPAEEVPSGAYSPDGSVIFEKDGLKVTTAGLDTDPTSIADIPIIWVDIENSGGEDVYLGVDNGSVNGFMTTVVLIEFYDEAVDGYIGGNSEFGVAVPAGEGVRRALGYYGADIPGVDPDTLAELEFSFTTAEDEYSWRNYVSEPVVIRTGETMEDVDLSALGTVGLSLGITSQLGLLSRIVLMILMFLGRVGSLTIAYAAFSSTDSRSSRFPHASVTVG